MACLLLATPAFAQPPAPNPEVEAIRREMEQLRQDYETRLRQLDERLKAVEAGQPAAAPATPPVATPPSTAPAPPVVVVAKPEPAPATNAVAKTGEERRAVEDFFANTTESRNYYLALAPETPLADRLEKVLNNFLTIGGYVRAGYGRNDAGGTQVAFAAPGALSKYRLGNETENYGELVFSKDWYGKNTFSLEPGETSPEPNPGKPLAHVQVRLAFADPYGAGDTQFTVPEAWGAVANVIPGNPSATFWAGNRFYRRYDINISDFYFYNMSGAGGGIEDVQLPFGQFNLAWIGESSQNASYGEYILPDAVNEAGFAKSNVDLRLHELKVPYGLGEIGVNITRAEGGLNALDQQVPDTVGAALNLVHIHDQFIDPTGQNVLSLQLGYGPSKTFNSGFNTQSTPDGLFIVPDYPDSWRFRLTENFIAQPWEEFSISPALVFQYTDNGRFEGVDMGAQYWFSAGVRPIYHFSKYVNLAFEGGVDWVNDVTTRQSGYLYKLTVAPQVSLGRLFMSRPVLRLYLTYAGWSESFKNQVGGSDYYGETEGLAWGFQMETWW